MAPTKADARLRNRPPPRRRGGYELDRVDGGEDLNALTREDRWQRESCGEHQRHISTRAIEQVVGIGGVGALRQATTVGDGRGLLEGSSSRFTLVRSSSPTPAATGVRASLRRGDRREPLAEKDVRQRNNLVGAGSRCRQRLKT